MITIEQMIKSRDFSAVNMPDTYSYVFLSILDGNTAEQTAQLFHEDFGYPTVVSKSNILRMFHQGKRYLLRYAKSYDTNSIFLANYDLRTVCNLRKCITNNVYTLEGLHNLIEKGVINYVPRRF